MSVPIYEKPLPHIGLADWFAKQWQNQQTNATRRSDAFKLRHESRQLRNETRIQTEWDAYHSNAILADRVTELERWKHSLKSCLTKVASEINVLKDEKFATERDLDALGIPLNVVAECISMRDCRQGAELTYDEGDTELKKELCMLEGVKKMLVERCQSTWEKLNKLELVRTKLIMEINEKTESIEIDTNQLTLDKNCANITFKLDPLRIVKNSHTYDSWLEHTKAIKQIADNEMTDTFRLRESLFVVRTRAKNDMISQRDRVDFILRKRIYETQKARNELEWQQKIMKDEMEKMVKEIKTLEDSLEDKTDACKLCETRLENRSYRPGFELARDDVDKSLKEEVLQLRQTRNDLQDKINCAKSTYNALEDQLVLIDQDLADKSQSLMTDIRCLDLRIRLRTGLFAGATTDTDRNIQLTRMENEIPPT